MKTRTLFAAIAVSSIWVSNAQAVEFYPGYFGLSVGQAEVDDFCSGAEISSCDDSAVTARLYGGSEYIGFANFEFGYRYLDEVSASGTVEGLGFASAEVEGHFFDATLQLGMPRAGRFKVFAKAGAMFWQLNYEATAQTSGGNLRFSDDDTGVALRTGLGASFNVSENFRVRADWDFLMDVGDEDETGESDINVFSIGPEFLF
ncbi:outer membrane beta-barrel protein [Marinobacter pelagius]|uniref:outer membrane beta-barrel protein n=1 Tax=Marinobacter sp. C7 TaxID=2951363 RepID=UPI001EF15C93|nr:outer membrane beta-barrel protein [Marinobacter sp. C7]MCG7199742.1 outer membrane beta-barrel protein [Marinobacter sp. C7]